MKTGGTNFNNRYVFFKISEGKKSVILVKREK